jgi:UDP-3-O-[3-hydroxymyristoyl] glucosamine N-acyltransferase
MLAAQTGIAGSTLVGSGVVFGGQAGLVGHINVGDGAAIGAQAGVTKDVRAGATVSGYPARLHEKARRVEAITSMLPELLERIRKLERRSSVENSEGLESGTDEPETDHSQ